MKGLNNADKHEIRINRSNFYVESVNQMCKRFSLNSRDMKNLKLLKFLDPHKVQSKESIGPLASFFPNLINDVNALDRKFRKLKLSNFDFEEKQKIFWKKVVTTTRGDSSLAFP